MKPADRRPKLATMALSKGTVRRFNFKGVEGLRVGRFDLGINTTNVVYRLGGTVIDTGPPHKQCEVLAFLRETPVKRVLLTHHHEDHSGNAAAIQRSLGAQVFAHVAALPHLAAGFPLRPYQHILFGRPRPIKARPLPPEFLMEEGGRLVPFHTPGHSEDLVCYLEPEQGWLFTGDLYVGDKPRYLREDEDLALQIASLREVLRLDFQTVFCAHRGVVVNGRRALSDKLHYLETLCGQARSLHKQGWPIARITRHLLGKEDLTSFATLYHFTKTNLIRGCLSGEDL